MEHLILIKYGEMTTKKGNRQFFIKTLIKNIKNRLSDLEYSISNDNVRMYIKCNDDSYKEIEERLKTVCGIHSFCHCYKCENDIDKIKEMVLNLVKQKSFKTFKCETNRAYKKFDIPSMEVSRQVGGHILKNIPNIKVDVHNPELQVNIDIRYEGTYIYFDDIISLGGYPVGTLGKGLLMISGGIDSPVSGFLSQKRGMELECIYFDSPPHTSIEARNKVESLIKVLTTYQTNIRLHIIPFTHIQEEIYKNCDPTYLITIMRRMMYRISERVAEEIQADVIINGENVGQVASQTLKSIRCINSVITLPVLRPVVCFDKLEIIDISKKIKTYDISILPFEDCCTIFVPKHPIINPSIEKCIEEENKINYEPLIKEAVEQRTIKIIKYNEKEYGDIL